MTAATTAAREVDEIVPELPFDDDSSTFIATLLALAEVHALDDEE